MSNVNEYLRNNVKVISQKNVHVAPEIPEKKLNNAITAFKYEGSPRSVVALYDDTLLGSGKDGILFSGERFIYRASFTDPVHVSFKDIKEARKGKKESDDVVIVETHSGSQIVIKTTLDCDYDKLAEVIQKASVDFDEHVEEVQYIALEAMSEKLKVAYLKIIIGMTYADDGEMDKKELAEILLLITRLSFKSESRFEIRSYMTSIENLVDTRELIAVIDAECPPGQQHNVHVSLAKDLISTHLSTGGKTLSDFDFLNQHKSLLAISQGEIEMAEQAIRTDRELLNDDADDDMIVASLKALAAKAAAVGTPLAAIYLSGSVVGLSAAGLTSGLAAMGFGGVLGISGMTAGIGVAVLIGVGAYVGVRKLTGADEVAKSAKREMMLNQVIRQTQKTISLLIEDINFLIAELNKALAFASSQEVKIRELMQMMTALTAAGAVLSERSDMAQRSVTKIHCARYLDMNKLRMLTQEPTKVEIGQYIVSFYEEKELQEERNGENIAVKKMCLKQNVSSPDLRSLSEAFEAVGYFSASDVVVGAANDLKNKAKDKLSGWFS